MSIISEALKKANADRHRSPEPDGRRRPGSSGGQHWAVSLILLTLVTLPFVLPRLAGRSGDAPSRAPMALPASGLSSVDDATSAGLAQTSIESRALSGPGAIFSIPGSPSASATPEAGAPASPRKDAVTSINGRRLQGIVWTANKGYYAILDSEVIRVGSVVDGMRVTQVSPAGVELSDGTDTVFIEKVF